MSFLGVKVILFWVIPLIIKEKSNASALRIDRYEHVERSMRMFISTVMNMWNGRYETTFSRVLRDKRLVLKQLYSRVQAMKTWYTDDEGMGCRR